VGLVPRFSGVSDHSGGSLKFHLDNFLDSFPREKHLSNDPVQFVHRYQDPRDREIAGLIASVFAYGNVKSVLRTVDAALGYLGPWPAQAIASFDPMRDARRLRGFYHRFNTSRDLAVLFWIIRRALETFGSLESAFTHTLSSTDADIGNSLENFCATLLGFGHEELYPRGELKRRIGVRFLFPRPSEGSACKRMNLFLRWMVRNDAVDPGGWTRIPASKLLVPLDTHTIRVGKCLRLTQRMSPGWKMAADITAALRAVDPVDPVRYDFALCHLSMMGACGFGTKRGNADCPLKMHCRPLRRANGPRRRSPSGKPSASRKPSARR